VHVRTQQRLFPVAITAIVLAATSFAERVPDCTPGKLSDYERLGAQGCAIGDEHFSNFMYQPSPNGPAASAISVTPGTVTDSDDPALLFEAAWIAPISGSYVSYDIEVEATGNPISAATLEMQFGQITGTGAASVSAELHLPSDSPSTCRAAELTLNVFLAASQRKKAMDKRQLKDPVRRLSVVTPVSITPGRNGSARLAGFMTVFHSSAAQSASANTGPALSPAGR
jgi:hypothetical protein